MIRVSDCHSVVGPPGFLVSINESKDLFDAFGDEGMACIQGWMPVFIVGGMAGITNWLPECVHEVMAR